MKENVHFPFLQIEKWPNNSNTFHSLNRTLPLRGEDRMRLNKAKQKKAFLLCFVFGFHYLWLRRRYFVRKIPNIFGFSLT